MSGAPRAPPSLMPSLVLSRGRVMRRGTDGAVPARDADGNVLDLFSTADELIAAYGRLYVVDLDGIDRDRPELDYLQELARDAEVWVDAGVRVADEAIDLIVAGASRAVLSTSTLQGPTELARAWSLSPEIVCEVDLAAGTRSLASRGWAIDPAAVLAQVRGVGLTDAIVRYPDGPIPWADVGALAAAGPLWVAGSIGPHDRPQIEAAGLRGGIFPSDLLLPEAALPGSHSSPARAG